MVALVWGSTFVIVKDALVEVPPFTFLALRFGIASVVLLATFHRRISRLGPGDGRAGLAIGAFLFAGYACQTVGLQLTSASRAGFITGLSVLIVPLLARLILRQPLVRTVAVGIGLATVGMWLMTADGSSPLALGDLLIFGCAVAFAAQIVMIGAYAPRYDPVGLAVVQIGFVALLAALSAGILERPIVVPSASVALAAGYTGILGTAAALAIQNVAQRFTSASHTALAFSLEPVFAALFAVMLAGERLGVAGLVGGGLIVLGMIVAEVGRRWRSWGGPKPVQAT